MGREIRMVPPGWQHPTEWGKDWRTGRPKLRFRPLFDGNAAELASEWDEENAGWQRGETRDWGTKEWKPKSESALQCETFEEWHGNRPKAEDYMPLFADGTATHLMMYETTSEGTPISPAFATPEELARWLADNGASSFGDSTATYEEWLSVCRGGWAPSAVMDAKGFRSGVEAMADIKAHG